MYEIQNENEFVRALVIQLINSRNFASLSLDNKRTFQVVTVARYLLLQGYAHGTGAIDPAVRVCKKTQIGTSWLIGQKISQMLARTLAGTGVSAFSAAAESTESMVLACERTLEAIAPDLLRDNFGDEDHENNEDYYRLDAFDMLAGALGTPVEVFALNQPLENVLANWSKEELVVLNGRILNFLRNEKVKDFHPALDKLAERLKHLLPGEEYEMDPEAFKSALLKMYDK